MKIEMKGFDDAIRKLNDLQRRADRLNGEHRVPISQLLVSSFMLQNTPFESFEAMLSASGFKVETTEDFEAIPDDEWDAYVVKVTRFASWQDMLEAAGKEWAVKELGL